MFKKVGVSLLAAMMLSSVALACDYSSIDDEDFLWDFSLVDDGGNKQVSKQEGLKVIKFDKQFIKEFIMKEEKCSEWEANLIVNAVLPKMSNKLQPVLDAYLADRTVDSTFHVKEVTMPIIMKGYQCGFWPALTYMDMFIQRQDNAEISLQTLILPQMAADRDHNGTLTTAVYPV
jgi:hypothetical protein